MSAQAQLKQQMEDDKYYFTNIKYQSIVKCSSGYYGFMISYGLWYKLRVYHCYQSAQNVTISDPLIYEYDNYKDALQQIKTFKC